MRKLRPQEGHDLYEFPMGSYRRMRMVNQSNDSGLVFNARSGVWCQPAASPTPRGTLRCFWCSSTCSVTQLCLTLCEPKDFSSPGSSIHGIFQARILEWAAVSSSRGSFLPRVQTHISCVSCIGRWVLYHCATWEAPSK